jgi:hypothetical protein
VPILLSPGLGFFTGRRVGTIRNTKYSLDPTPEITKQRRDIKMNA